MSELLSYWPYLLIFSGLALLFFARVGWVNRHEDTTRSDWGWG